MIRVVCLKWGGKYHFDYVNNLYGMVSRSLSERFEFYCLTDCIEGLDDRIITIDIPDFGLAGWWNKLLLFKKDFLPFEEGDKVLYFDLDVVILNPIMPLLDMKSRLMISSDDKPSRMNSSVMVFKYNELNFIWDSFWTQKEFIISNFHGDQDWIERVFPSATIYSKEMVASFKLDLKSKTLWSFGMLGRSLRRKFSFLLPRGEVERPSSIVVLFHGLPNPEDVMEGPWDKYKHAPWVKTAWNHKKKK